jgi:hypothetical protein
MSDNVNMSNGETPIPPSEEPTRYFGVFNAEGRATAFYNTEIYEPEGEARNSKIPAEAIEITYDQWRELLSNPLQARYVDGEVIMIDPPPMPKQQPSLLDEIKQMLAGMNERLKKLEAG